MKSLTEKLRTFAKEGVIAIAAAGLIASGCGIFDKKEDDSGQTGGSSDKTQCYEASTEIDASGLVHTWQAEGSHGANHFYLHELAATCNDAEYCFKNGMPVKDYVLRRDEYIPASAWNAWRPVQLDGKDPREFLQEDPLIVGYLPWIQKSVAGWKNDNTTYDWSCAESQCDDPQGYHYNINNACGETNGLENCLGLNQLDRSFTPSRLAHGKQYLARFLFGANPNDTGNWIEACNQAVLDY